MKSRVTMKTRLCPHQHLWVLFLYCSPTLNTNYAWSVSVCACACMCVHVCVCVCEGWRRRLPPVLDSNLQPLNLHIKPSILKPSAGGLTRWDGIDRIGLDMMSGSSGVVCTLQAACSQEERGRGGDEANHSQSQDMAILFPTMSCTAAQTASSSHSSPAWWLKSGTACPGHDPGTLPVPDEQHSSGTCPGAAWGKRGPQLLSDWHPSGSARTRHLKEDKQTKYWLFTLVTSSSSVLFSVALCPQRL